MPVSREQMECRDIANERNAIWHPISARLQEQGGARRRSVLMSLSACRSSALQVRRLIEF